MEDEIQLIDATRRILGMMEAAANDPTKRRDIRAALREGRLDATAMFQLGLQFGACAASDEHHLRRDWGNEGQAGWFGEIMDQVNRGFLDALEKLGDEPSRKLRLDWVKRPTATFHIEVDRTAWGVSMRIVTPTPREPGTRQPVLAK